MPRKPTTAELKAKAANITGQDVVSAIMAEDPALAQRAANAGVLNLVDGESGEKIVQVPDDNSSIMNLYKFLMGYEPNRNAFLYALMNRIGMTILTSRMWDSPLKFMLRGRLEYGESVEEIFVNLVKVQSFDPTAANVRQFERNPPDVRAAFHVMNFQKDYPLTLHQDMLRQAFLSWQGIVDLVQGAVAAMFKSLNKDFHETTLYMIAKAVLNGEIPSVAIPDFTDKANLEDVVTVARTTALNMTDLNTRYNMAGVYNSVNDVSDLHFIIQNDLLSAQSVSVLAQAYNMTNAEFLGRAVAVRSFSDLDWNRLDQLFSGTEGYDHFDGTQLGNLQKIGMIIVGPEFGQIYQNFQEVTDNYMGSTLQWQYWLHAWYTFSLSPFEVCACLNYAGGEVANVVVSPATANVAQGTTIALTANVTGTGFYNSAVTWAISGQKSPATQIVGNQLTIGSDETASTQITVTATSVANSEKSGTATITVVAA